MSTSSQKKKKKQSPPPQQQGQHQQQQQLDEQRRQQQQQLEEQQQQQQQQQLEQQQLEEQQQQQQLEEQQEEQQQQEEEEQQPGSPVPEAPKLQEEQQQRPPVPLRRSRSMSLRSGPGEQPGPLTGNFTQDLQNVFGHYQDSVANLERLQLLADAKGGGSRGGGGDPASPMFSQQQQQRRGGRRLGFEGPPFDGGCESPDSCMEFELHPGEIRSMEIKSADEYGAKFVATFRALMLRGSGCPSRSSQHQLATIVANNEMHKSALVSVQAAAALEELREVYPATELRADGSSSSTEGGGEGGQGGGGGGGRRREGGGDDGR